MVFKPDKNQPDFDSLITSLNNAKIQTNNNALYQTIFNLIQRVRQARDLNVTNINNNTTNIEKVAGVVDVTVVKVNSVIDSDILTGSTVDTTKLPNALQLVAGTNITLTPGTNQLVIAATSTTGSSSGVTTTGTIITGGLVKFASDTTITSALLSGDVIGSTNSTLTTINTGAVTEAKQTLADNTTWNVSTTQHGYVPKATGSTTDFLRADGTYATPAGGGGGSGALVLLEQHTAATSANLDVTAITTTYDDYMLELINITPVTNDVSVHLRVSTDGGATYDSGNNYAYSQFLAGSAGFTGGGGSDAAAQFLLGGTVISTTASGGMSGTVKITNPLGGATFTRIAGEVGFRASNDNHWYSWRSEGAYTTTTAVNGIRILMSSGSIASGTIRLYGISK